MEKLIEIINREIQVNTFDGKPLAESQFSYLIENPDESGIITVAWRFKENCEENELDAQEALITNIRQLFLDYPFSEEWVITHSSNGFTIHIENEETHDWVRLQFSDFHIYLIIFNSGQY